MKDLPSTVNAWDRLHTLIGSFVQMRGLSPGRFARRLGIDLAPTKSTETFEEYLAESWDLFRTVELRLSRRRDEATLILDLSEGTGLRAENTSFERYGHQLQFDLNQRLPPNGVASKLYVRGCVQIWFSVDLQTSFLRSVSLIWDRVAGE